MLYLAKLRGLLILVIELQLYTCDQHINNAIYHECTNTTESTERV